MALDVKRVELELEINQDIDQIKNRSMLSRAFGDNAASTAKSTAKLVVICVFAVLMVGAYLGATAMAARYNMDAQRVAQENQEFQRTLTSLTIAEGQLRNINRVNTTTLEMAQFTYPNTDSTIEIASGEFAPKGDEIGHGSESFASNSKNMLSSLLKSPSKQ